MSEIKLIPEEDLDNFITIAANAYPGLEISKEEDRQKMKERLLKLQNEDKIRHLYGLYREGILLGGMILFDFPLRLLSVKTLAGGVGFVAVDLLHKREKVCKDMITFFVNHYKEKGACMTLLYPFRPDFYKEMGFGFGTKMHQYRLAPHQLPKGEKGTIQFVGSDEKEAVIDCYNRYAEKTHGMIEDDGIQLSRFLDNPDFRAVCYKKGDKIQGYLVFTFKKGGEESFIINDIHVEEFVYETREALTGLLTFLHSQKDQIRYIIIDTPDEYFHSLLPDPRNDSDLLIPSVYHVCHTSGVGLMYRVIDVKRFFTILKDHNFGNQNCTVKICIQDSFLKENEGDTIIHFKDGRPHLGEKEYDIEISLDISEFSSFVMGVIPFKKLYEYGLADISDVNCIDVVTALFRTEEKPVCTTRF
ncbi:MAG: GNAT family N-acetyltransferase [Theionarchaea archaeon]|nr:GNAT family N-acetyltransferase [Theionarchaea archaeon]